MLRFHNIENNIFHNFYLIPGGKDMSSKVSFFKKAKAPLLIMILTIILSFLVPTVLAQPDNLPKENLKETPENSNLFFNLEAFFTVQNYNEPSNPWALVNYYFENGSSIRMVFGIDRTVFPTLNLDYQNNYIQVFDKKGKVCGLGLKSKDKSNLFVYVPM
jgi:hypothetical protein